MPKFVWKRGHTVAAIVTAAVVVGGGAVAIALDQPSAPSSGPPASSTASASAASPTPSAEPATPSPSSSAEPSDFLTGEKVSDHGVFAVKIENIAAARPQVGLRSADIVFAEQVEGAQTRLIAVFHSTFPKRLGPVRSARSTDVQLLPLFGKPGLVYSGANSRVQAKIDKASIVPIERSTRDHSRPAPHNVFVNLASIADSHRTGKVRDIGWRFAADDPRWAAASKADQAKGRVGNDTFTFDYASGTYVVKWRGQSYKDGDSGKTATTDNVVIMSVHDHPDGNKDVLGSPSVMSDTVGSGKVTVFRDGRRLSGTWKRTSPDAPLTFTDSDGADITLKPGNTWVLLKG